MGVLEKIKKLTDVCVYTYAALAFATCSFRMQLETNRTATIAKQSAVIAAQRSYIESLKCKLDVCEHPTDAYNCPETKIQPSPPASSALAMSVFGGF